MARTLRILVADDSRTVHMFFRRAIALAESVELFAVEDGDSCATLLKAGGVDLAFIDVNMPGISGLEALGAARLKGNKTFVALMSGKTSPARLEVARRLHAYEYLVKPFTAEDILAVIATCRRVGEPMSTLLVDDSRTIRGVIRRVLEQSIFRLTIEEADDGVIGLERCRETPFDIVFLDCNMPGFNGLETLDRLKQRKRDARVIMISAERDDASIAQAMERGAATFLQKPFFAHDVDRALHQALGLKLPGLADAPSIAPDERPFGTSAIYID